MEDMEVESKATPMETLDIGDPDEGAEVSLTADGGLKKKILTKGEGSLRPEAGDEVTVHYTGTLLDGTKFDSSRDRDDPFVFTLKDGEDRLFILAFSLPISWKSHKDILGDGGVMKTELSKGTGWDKPRDRDEVLVKYTAKVSGQPDAAPFSASPPEGSEFVVQEGLEGMSGVGRTVKTMKEGERASLLIQPQYAYGEQGRDGLVPPNASVEVDLELVSWKKVEDVAGDGAVCKKILQSGRDWKTPNEELVSEGLDTAVMKMKKGEKAEVVIRPPYSYPEGHAGKKAQVPSNAVLKYNLELVDFVNAKESYEMDNDEKVAAGERLKEKGNKAYKESKLERAVRLYDQAMSCVSYDKNFPEGLRAKSGAIKKGVSLNLAAANLKLKDYREAIKNCDKALEVDPNNTKALYRRAQAFLAQGDTVEAEQDVKSALLLAPKDPDLLALQKKLRAVMKEEAQKQKSLYSKMFSKPLVSDAPQQPPATSVPENGTSAPENGVESDTLPPGTQPAPKGSVLLEEV
ncbi:hypothetical protein DUNSADRAFT_13203 [Dunaliella salina]|uniref:peptidylprolyl isomerase n=1 Tax=Dunaliella salina TaxID=3046 RepID=A0ABQ7G9T1_DUNSA|nr:hypothetical protein DUNSADRAFT_13203 [Dunaliella salina]|eukprot:KAF5831361.1 hypothetical protein DUNSADRAFT_13203 [Dunaliella salina]